MSLQFRSKLFEINFYKCCPINLSHSSTVLKFSLEQNILLRKLLVSIFLFPINYEQFLSAKYNLCSSFPFFHSCLKIEIRLRLLETFLFLGKASSFLIYFRIFQLSAVQNGPLQLLSFVYPIQVM